MSLSKIITLIFILFFLSCNKKRKATEGIFLQKINHDYIDSNSTCKEHTNYLIITPKLINNFIDDLKKKYSKDSFERIIIAFYVEGGEVIQFYKIGLMISQNELLNAHLISSSGEEIVKKGVRFNIDDFYDSISKSQEDSIINHHSLLLIDIKTNNSIMCYSYDNIKTDKGNSIKNLNFLNEF